MSEHNPEPDYAHRAQKEREQWNQGLKRDLYSRILSHCGAFTAEARLARIAQALQPAEGRRVLEIGSHEWINFLEPTGITPAELHCINISEKEIEIGRQFIETSRLKPQFHLMDAHELQFEDDSFDVVFGGAILHHLQLDRALSEIRRVLKPGGSIVFLEPLDTNPVAKLVRLLTPQARTPDELPFTFKELGILRSHFDVDISFYELLSVPFGVLSGFVFRNPKNFLTRFAYWLDHRLLIHVPGLRYLYRNMVITNRPSA